MKNLKATEKFLHSKLECDGIEIVNYHLSRKLKLIRRVGISSLTYVLILPPCMS